MIILIVLTVKKCVKIKIVLVRGFMRNVPRALIVILGFIVLTRFVFMNKKLEVFARNKLLAETRLFADLMSFDKAFALNI